MIGETLLHLTFSSISDNIVSAVSFSRWLAVNVYGGEADDYNAVNERKGFTSDDWRKIRGDSQLL